MDFKTLIPAQNSVLGQITLSDLRFSIGKKGQTGHSFQRPFHILSFRKQQQFLLLLSKETQMVCSFFRFPPGNSWSCH